MLLHNLKIAFRNMWKYRSQTAISIVGLAVGFTCFALSALWIRYEMSYDSFHKAADRTFVVNRPSFLGKGVERYMSAPLATYLKETFPEIEDAAAIVPAYRPDVLQVDSSESKASYIEVDTNFLRLFDIKIIEGDADFLLRENRKWAVTQEKARQLWGNKSAIGKEFTLDGHRRTVGAVVEGWSKHTNYRFDFIAPFYSDWRASDWESHSTNVFIRTLPGTNIQEFSRKLYNLNDEKSSGKSSFSINKLSITPITKMHYTDLTHSALSESSMRFYHILLFAVTGLLVIICVIVNYLSLFICRFNIRRKELAMRIVWGASNFSLFILLVSEFLITLAISIVLALIIIDLVFAKFLEMSDIMMNLSDIYLESAIYFAATITVLVIVFALVIWILRRRALNVSIRSARKNIFRRVAIIVQLIISISFSFAAVVLVLQMNYLHNSTDKGFNLHNRGAITVWDKSLETVFEDKLRQLPEIVETVSGKMPILNRNTVATTIGDWEDKNPDAQPFNMEFSIIVKPEYCNFYEFQLLKGEMLEPTDSSNLVLINETAAKRFGWENPVGKKFGNYIVKGVIKDVCNRPPTQPVDPTLYMTNVKMFFGGEEIEFDFGHSIVFKYQGTWKTVRQKIETALRESFPDTNIEQFKISNTEEEYGEFLKAEQSLLILLSFVAFVCVLICIFGFVSLISLSCEERRKEIAIRKINGATVLDILNIFFKENFLLLIIGALVAFPIGYYVMRQWLEQYVRQTPIGAWVYLTIIAAMAAVIVMCVGWRVWRASVENPAEVVKMNN